MTEGRLPIKASADTGDSLDRSWPRSPVGASATKRPGASKRRPLGDRYFVVNRYQGKNGLRVTSTEFVSHEAACAGAAGIVVDLVDLTGSCDEEFIVFVGSKSELDRRFHR